MLEKLQSQDTTFDDYISFLHARLNKLYGYLSSSKLSKVIYKLSKRFHKIRPIPETTKLVTPVFTAGQYSKVDVAKLLGKIDMKETKLEMRKIKPMEIVSPSSRVESASKQKKQDRHTKSVVKQTPSLPSSVNDVRKFNVPGVSQIISNYDVKEAMPLSPSVIEVRQFIASGVNDVFHFSLDKAGRLWVSSSVGNLFQIDLQGNQLHEIQTSGGYGYHTVTQDEELIFTERRNKLIEKITPDGIITEFIKTGDWEPISIHSSHINRDILVGMRKDGNAKVKRCCNRGKKIQNIKRDNEGQVLYDWPHYITENINGDVCVSDYNKRALVVVNKSGHHRFSYTGQGSNFWPYGICTDVFGHIVVCDKVSHSVHQLDQDGQFLSQLITQGHGVYSPVSVCVDDENNIYVGQKDSKTVIVYSFLMEDQPEKKKHLSSSPVTY
jgi:hypothetical protein